VSHRAAVNLFALVYDKMRRAFEGFNLELRVRHSIDVVGGPLLDEE
jgi:hypothetical protein